VLTEEQRRENARKNVTVINRGEKVPEWDGASIPPSGGTDPKTFWNRPDPAAGRMKRPTRSERRGSGGS
jgi:hypothetical protein